MRSSIWGSKGKMRRATTKTKYTIKFFNYVIFEKKSTKSKKKAKLHLSSNLKLVFLAKDKYRNSNI